MEPPPPTRPSENPTAVPDNTARMVWPKIRSIGGCGDRFLRVQDRLEGAVFMLLHRELVDEGWERGVHRLARTVRIIAVEIVANRPGLAVDVGRDIPGVLDRQDRRVVAGAERHVAANKTCGSDQT